MARPKKSLDQQKGNLTVLQQEKKKREESYIKTGKNQLKTPPIWLVDDIAKAEFKRVTKELCNIEIVGNLDLNNIGSYCNALSNYIHVSEELRGQTYTIDRETRNGVIVVKNPLIDVQTLYASELRRFGSLCGLDINSRLKAANEKIDKEEQTVNKKFGI